MSQETLQQKTVSQSVIDVCMANVVAEGDIVNFRFLFMPASPLRPSSPEDIHSPKYGYLFPEDESAQRYQNALRLVQRSEITRYIQKQLATDGAAAIALGTRAGVSG